MEYETTKQPAEAVEKITLSKKEVFDLVLRAIEKRYNISACVTPDDISVAGSRELYQPVPEFNGVSLTAVTKYNVRLAPAITLKPLTKKDKR